MKKEIKPPQILFVRELCKDSTEEEIQAAEARLMHYLDLCKEAVMSAVEEQEKAGFDKTADD